MVPFARTEAIVPPRHTVFAKGIPALFATGLLTSTRLAVRVVSLRAPTVIDKRPCIRIRLRDVRNETEFDSTPLFELDMVNRAREALETGDLLEAHGQFTSDNGSGGKRRSRESAVFFDIHTLGDPSRPSIITGATEQELVHADELIDRLRATPGALREYIISNAMKVLNMVSTRGQAKD